MTKVGVWGYAYHIGIMSRRAGLGLILMGAAMIALAHQQLAAEPIRHAGTLRGDQLVPAADNRGLGSVQTALTGNQLMWLVSFYGLTEPATAVGLLGAGGGGVTAQLQLDLGVNGIDNIMAGTTELTALQRAALLAGDWYVRVDTASQPQGALRGQLELFD